MTNTPLNTDAVTAVARALNEAGWTCYEGGMEPGKYDGCEDCQEVCNELARKALAAYLAVAQPVVNSVSELEALPLGTSIVSDGQVATSVAWSRKHDTSWSLPALDRWVASEEVGLPATVLYRPNT